MVINILIKKNNVILSFNFGQNTIFIGYIFWNIFKNEYDIDSNIIVFFLYKMVIKYFKYNDFDLFLSDPSDSFGLLCLKNEQYINILNKKTQL